MLFEQGVPIRADWEVVLSAVVDTIVEREEIDADRIALTGWSLGGHLALRAASGEPRLAACIADPALIGIGAGAIGRLRAAGISASVIERYPNIDSSTPSAAPPPSPPPRPIRLPAAPTGSTRA